MRTTKKMNAYTLAFIGVMAAIVYVVTMFRFPLLGSKVHFANAMCLLGGMLFGPLYGGLASGIGSALYDLTMYNEGIVNLLITFVSKFAMAWVCIAAVAGALTYVALYMLKTFIFQKFVYAFPMETVWATMLSKFIPSIINAAVAVVAAPILFKAVMPALRQLLNKE